MRKSREEKTKMAKRSLTVRLHESEHELLDKLSASENLTKTDIVRYALKNIEKSGQSIEDRTTLLDELGETKAEIRRLTVAINKVGRNVNSVAKKANKTGVVSEEDYQYSLKILKSILSNQAKLRERLLTLWQSLV